jgi:hypothetical protein
VPVLRKLACFLQAQQQPQQQQQQVKTIESSSFNSAPPAGSPPATHRAAAATYTATIHTAALPDTATPANIVSQTVNLVCLQALQSYGLSGLGHSCAVCCLTSPIFTM